MGTADARESVEKFILALQSALQARAMYGESHRLTTDALVDAHAILQEAVLARQEITLGVIGDKLVFDRQPLFRLGKAAEGLMAIFIKAKIEKVMFRKATSRDELGAFLVILDTLRNADDKADQAIDTSGLRHIVIEGIAIEEAGSDEKTDGALRACAADYAEGVDLLGDIARSIGDGRSITSDRCREALEVARRHPLPHRPVGS